MSKHNEVSVLGIISKLSDIAVDCDFLSEEENKTFCSLPKGFRETDFGVTMRNIALALTNVAGEARYWKEELQSIIE